MHRVRPGDAKQSGDGTYRRSDTAPGVPRESRQTATLLVRINMPTVVIIDFQRPDGTTGSMSSDVKHADTSVEYYRNMGYEVSTETLILCDTCNGTGKVQVRNRRHDHSFCVASCFKTCPNCS